MGNIQNQTIKGNLIPATLLHYMFFVICFSFIFQIMDFKIQLYND